LTHQTVLQTPLFEPVTLTITVTQYSRWHRTKVSNSDDENKGTQDFVRHFLSQTSISVRKLGENIRYIFTL